MSRAATAAGLLHASGVRSLAAKVWSGVVVLCHHRIGDPRCAAGDPGVFGATPDQLDEQLHLLRSEFELIEPGDLEAALGHRGRAVLLTFDDGYRDNVQAALPVLQAHGAKAAFFVATSFVDRARWSWWDELAWIAKASGRPRAAARWQAHYKLLAPGAAAEWLEKLERAAGTGAPPAWLARDEWMTWDDVRTLRDAGMTLGGHTHDHPVLARLPVAEQRRQIERGLGRIAAETGVRPTWFAYPVGARGSWTPVTERLLADAGIERAFSFYGGANPVWRRSRYDTRRMWVPAETGVLRALVDLPAIFGRG